MTGTQKVAGVGEKADHANGAGLLIDLTIGERDFSRMRVDAAVGKSELQGNAGLVNLPATRKYSCSLMGK